MPYFGTVTPTLKGHETRKGFSRNPIFVKWPKITKWTQSCGGRIFSVGVVRRFCSAYCYCGITMLRSLRALELYTVTSPLLDGGKSVAVYCTVYTSKQQWEQRYCHRSRHAIKTAETAKPRIAVQAQKYQFLNSRACSIMRSVQFEPVATRFSRADFTEWTNSRSVVEQTWSAKYSHPRRQHVIWSREHTGGCA